MDIIESIQYLTKIIQSIFYSNQEGERMVPDAQTRWRCRRGMLENDLVLEAFLQDGYDFLDQEGRDAFERLLDYPDDLLWQIILGQQQTIDTEIARLVPLLRQAAASSHSP